MKQVLQNLSSGDTYVEDVPHPQCPNDGVVINTVQSLISSGTERMLVEFGKANLLGKVLSQPDKVREVANKIRTDGIATTYDAVRSKLNQPITLGYSTVGIVSESRTKQFKPGDRVVSNGPHAETITAKPNLIARVPDNVSDEAAAFTVVASIGLQGIRLAKPEIGECVVVIGAGLIGLLTIQMLLAQGCRVLAVDFDRKKLTLAEYYGANTCNPQDQDLIESSQVFSQGRGVDAVIITASTESSSPVSQAAQMSRTRGRIVLVGVTGLQLNRADFYDKELSFQVSCSYGPGRYDPLYEEKGQDYPLGFVRWTAQRNFEAVLEMMASGKLDVSGLISRKFHIRDAKEAYRALGADKTLLAILLDYDTTRSAQPTNQVALTQKTQPSSEKVRLGVIGAGNYASRMLIPAFKSVGVSLEGISSPSGTSATVHGLANGFHFASSEYNALLQSDEINTIAIATRHNSHAQLVKEALNAGKNVYVEKPLGLTDSQIDDIEATYNSQEKLHLMVGFNRRFSTHSKILKDLLRHVTSPKCFISVMNAGSIPANHWTQDEQVGGGRIVGEACHHIDLIRFLCGHPIVSVDAQKMGLNAAEPVTEDKAVITLTFADGSIGTIHYFANGGSSFPKERVEVFACGGTLQLDNFRVLRGFSWPGFRNHRLWRQDKGLKSCVKDFSDAVANGSPTPIPANEIFEVARAVVRAGNILRSK